MSEFKKEDVLRAVDQLEWASVRVIAEYMIQEVGDIVEFLNELKASGSVKTRIKGRGFQYGLTDAIQPPPREDPEETVVPQELGEFSTLDEFMQIALRKLPKDKDLSASELAESLLEEFPEVLWGKDDIIKNIAKMVRLKRLGLRPFIEDSQLKYNYVVAS